MSQHTIVVLATSHVIPFDLAVPLQIFKQVPRARYKIEVCGLRKGEVYKKGGLRILVEHGLEALERADTILVPGIDDWNAQIHPKILEALRAAHARRTRIASICTGAFVLAQAGLLNKRRATTHWAFSDELAKRYPEVTVDPKVLYIDEGCLVTSAGVTAGIDMCLHLIRTDYGEKVANFVAKVIVASPHRSGGQAQFIQRPIPPARSRGLDKTREWMLKNLDNRNMRVTDMADHAGLALRSFSRRFESETGMPPLQWIIEQRIRHAQLLLESTLLPIEEVAVQSGFTTTLSFRNHFKRIATVTPTDYRRTFLRTNDIRQVQANARVQA